MITLMIETPWRASVEKAMVLYPHLVYVAFVAQSHVHWISGNTTGIIENGCVTGSHHSWGEGQRLAVGQGHQMSTSDCVKCRYGVSRKI